MSTTTANLGLFKYDTTTDGNLAFNIQTALNDNWDKIDAAVTGGSSRNIGEIVTSTIPLTDAGLHLLDGALIQGSGIYSAFVDYIANLYNTDVINFYQWKVSNTSDVIYTKSETPSIGDTLYNSQGGVLSPTYSLISVGSNSITVSYHNSSMEYLRNSSGDFSQPQGYFTDDISWQSTVTQYGVCGKFVYDSVNNTVRLPKITGIIEGTTDLTALLDLIHAGLPNVSCFNIGADNLANRGTAEVPFYKTNVPADYTVGSSGSGASYKTGFDLSLANSIYGNSTTVQPQAIKVLYYIVIATTTKTNIEVDIDEIVTDLNGKADTSLSNVPNSKGILIESYRNGTEWYRIYSDGWCEQGGFSAPVAQDRQVCQVIFSNSFTNTDYYFNVRYISTSWVNAVIGVCSDTNRSLSSVYIWNFTTYSSGAYWSACGYIR